MKRVDQCYLPPGLCFICETTPQEGELVVDTERNFQAIAISALDGRKYLCGNCIRSAGEQIGLASDAALVKATEERDTALAKNAALKDKFRALAEELTAEKLEAAENAAPAVAVAAAEAAEAVEVEAPKSAKKQA